MGNRRKPEDWTESQLETLVCERVRKRKFKALKFFSKVDTGWPDRELLSPAGSTIWVEFKKPSGKMEALQRVNREWLIRNDHAYFLLDTYEVCIWFIENVVPFID